ncbi:MAG: hypothetical protein IJO93_07100 [Clostridia bacterium]|nr:hypothetical protein [Clostridia bacterium]
MKSLRDEIRRCRKQRTDLISSASADFIRGYTDFIGSKADDSLQRLQFYVIMAQRGDFIG